VNDESAFPGDEAVPKSYIRRMFKEVIDSPDASTEDRLRALDLLSKLEGYTGQAGTSKRDEMRVGVMIVQTSKLPENGARARKTVTEHLDASGPS